jgi:hypothetical protein
MRPRHEVRDDNGRPRADGVSLSEDAVIFQVFSSAVHPAHGYEFVPTLTKQEDVVTASGTIQDTSRTSKDKRPSDHIQTKS